MVFSDDCNAKCILADHLVGQDLRRPRRVWEARLPPQAESHLLPNTLASLILRPTPPSAPRHTHTLFLYVSVSLSLPLCISVRGCFSVSVSLYICKGGGGGGGAVGRHSSVYPVRPFPLCLSLCLCFSVAVSLYLCEWVGGGGGGQVF